MATETFVTVEEIQKHYDKQIQAAEEPLDQANLRAEKAERVSEFRERETLEVQRQSWITEAVATHQVPEDLREMLDNPSRYGNKEAIFTAAERLKGLQKSSEPPLPTAADVYGGSGVGGGTPPQTSRDPNTEFLDKMETDYNSHEARTARDMTRYAEIKLGRHLYAGMKKKGKEHIWGGQPAPDFERY